MGALLKLAEDVDMDIHTPACLAQIGADYTGQNGRVYGWGSTASCPATNQATLLEVELTIISDSECAAQTSDSVTFTDTDTGECVTESSSYDGRISDQMLCAGAGGMAVLRTACTESMRKLPSFEVGLTPKLRRTEE